MLWLRMFEDDDIADAGLRGIHPGNYIDCEANHHAKRVQDLYDWIQNGGFEPSWSNHLLAHGFYLGKTID